MKTENAASMPGLTLSPAAFAAALREHVKDIPPAQPTAENMVDRLAPHRAALLELRKQGYSTKQIASFLRDPKFGIVVAEITLRRLLQHAPRKSRAQPDRVKYNAVPAVAPTGE